VGPPPGFQHGRADLALEIFFPKSKNNFEAGFSRIKVYNVFASLTLVLGKSHLESFSDFGKKIYRIKLALPNNFSLGPKGFWKAEI
jgi:hypothetical protein